MGVKVKDGMYRKRCDKPVMAHKTGHGVRIAVVACAVAVASGCGGASRSGSSEAARTTAGVTKAQYLARADAICTRLNSEANYKGEHVKELLGGHKTVEALAASQVPQEIRKFAAFWRSGSTLLASVPAPAGDDGTLAKMEADRSNIAADLENFASAARNGDGSGIEAAETAIKETTETYDGLEQGYGFKVCGAGES